MTRKLDNMTSLLQERRVFPPPKHGRTTAHIADMADMAEYERKYAQSLADMEQFWARRAEELVTWTKKRDTVFTAFPGAYDTGDGARKDEDGYYWILGRLDDVINVSGHRLGTSEIESALVSHESVVEAAVVGMPHPVKGQAIYAYVTVNRNVARCPELLSALRPHVRREIGPIASPDVIQFAEGLPKTRSGKIMRRLLRKIAANDCENFGDISTLANPHVIGQLVTDRKNQR